MAPLTIYIQIFSDTACAWCYVSKVVLDRAMETYRGQYPDVDFELNWNPFYIFPEAKVSGYEKTTYYTRKFGPDRAQAFYTRIKRDGAELGLDLSFQGKVGNTRDSHLLLLLAQRQSQAHLQRLESVLFRGAFEEGKDISDRGFLLAAAREAGLYEGKDGDVLAWLDNKEAIRMVDALETRTKNEVGIVAVPSFVIQGRYRVGGKQEQSVFLDLFERIRKAEEERNTEEVENKGDESVQVQEQH